MIEKEPKEVCRQFLDSNDAFLLKSFELLVVELIRLRGTKNLELVRYELELLEEEKVNLSKQREFEWYDFWEKKELYRPLVVTVFIQLSQQLCGINAVNRPILTCSNLISYVLTAFKRSLFIRRVFSIMLASRTRMMSTVR